MSEYWYHETKINRQMKEKSMQEEIIKMKMRTTGLPQPILIHWKFEDEVEQ